VFTFFERGSQQPKALRIWFAPGRKYGQELVYPKAQAAELAEIGGAWCALAARGIAGRYRAACQDGGGTKRAGGERTGGIACFRAASCTG